MLLRASFGLQRPSLSPCDPRAPRRRCVDWGDLWPLFSLLSLGRTLSRRKPEHGIAPGGCWLTTLFAWHCLRAACGSTSGGGGRSRRLILASPNLNRCRSDRCRFVAKLTCAPSPRTESLWRRNHERQALCALRGRWSRSCLPPGRLANSSSGRTRVGRAVGGGDVLAPNRVENCHRARDHGAN